MSRLAVLLRRQLANVRPASLQATHNAVTLSSSSFTNKPCGHGRRCFCSAKTPTPKVRTPDDPFQTTKAQLDKEPEDIQSVRRFVPENEFGRPRAQGAGGLAHVPIHRFGRHLPRQRAAPLAEEVELEGAGEIGEEDLSLVASYEVAVQQPDFYTTPQRYYDDPEISSFAFYKRPTEPHFVHHPQPAVRSDRRMTTFDEENRLFAVMHIKNRQFKVTPGDLVTVDELRHLPVGEDIILRNALMVGGVHETVIGQPLVPAVEVHAHVREHTALADQIIFKMKRRKGYKRLNKHRQRVTILEINDIKYDGFKSKTS